VVFKQSDLSTQAPFPTVSDRDVVLFKFSCKNTALNYLNSFTWPDKVWITLSGRGTPQDPVGKHIVALKGHFP